MNSLKKVFNSILALMQTAWLFFKMAQGTVIRLLADAEETVIVIVRSILFAEKQVLLLDWRGGGGRVGDLIASLHRTSPFTSCN
jgi:hypothetical protein